MGIYENRWARTRAIALGIAVAAVLMGCGQKPPGCADAETTGLVNKMIADDFTAKVDADLKNGTNSADPSAILVLLAVSLQQRIAQGIKEDLSPQYLADIRQATDRYVKSLKTSVVNIVSNGYDDKAHKNSCAGKITVTTLSGQVFSVNSDFTTQGTVDDKSKFMLYVANYEPLQKELLPDFIRFLISNRVGVVVADAPPPATASSPPPVESPAAAPSPVVTPEPAPLVAAVAQQSQSAMPPTWMPSFDCEKASTGPERLICSNKELSEADVKLSQAYKSTLSASADKEAVRKDQSDWRKSQRDACADVACMSKAYQQRIAVLARVVAPASNASSTLQTLTGDIDVGRTDGISALIVKRGKEEKRYEFSRKGALGAKVFKVCSHDSHSCSITGLFDDEHETLLDVKNVEESK